MLRAVVLVLQFLAFISGHCRAIYHNMYHLSNLFGTFMAKIAYVFTYISVITHKFIFMLLDAPALPRED